MLGRSLKGARDRDKEWVPFSSGDPLLSKLLVRATEGTREHFPHAGRGGGSRSTWPGILMGASQRGLVWDWAI